MRIASGLARSASLRFALLYTLLFGLSVLLLFGVVYGSTLTLIERQVAETVGAELRGLADQYRTEGINGLLAAVNRRSGLDGATESIYLLADAEAQPLAGNLGSWPAEAVPDGEWLRLTLYRSGNRDEPILVGARSFVLPGGYHLLVGRDLRARTRLRDTLLTALGWALAATLALGLGGGMLLSRYMLRRIEAVNATSRRIMQGDLSHRVPLEGRGHEFDQLGESLNSMLERIEQLMTGMRLVTDSLAHDLRSPLTRLKGRLELTLRSGREPEDYRQSLEQAIVEIDTIQSTFNALIAIAEAESGVSRANREALDLAALAGDVAELYQPLAEDAGLRLAVELDGPAPIVGQRQLLAQAISNLLDNAIKYSPAGGTVTVRVAGSAEEILCCVADQGPGIPAEERAHVLERFVRLDSSRSQPGSGLGLSLVAAVAKLHESRLTLEDNGPGQDGAPGLRIVWRFAPAPTAA